MIGLWVGLSVLAILLGPHLVWGFLNRRVWTKEEQRMIDELRETADGVGEE